MFYWWSQTWKVGKRAVFFVRPVTTWSVKMTKPHMPKEKSRRLSPSHTLLHWILIRILYYQEQKMSKKKLIVRQWQDGCDITYGMLAIASISLLANVLESGVCLWFMCEKMLFILSSANCCHRWMLGVITQSVLQSVCDTLSVLW